MIVRRRSLIAAIAGAALACTALVACSNSNSGGTKGVTTLNWWTRVGTNQKAQVDQFNKTHPDIQVTVTQIPDDQYVNKVGTGIRSSNGPDVIDFDDANGPLFAATGVLADISTKVNALDYKASLNPGMSALGQYAGKTYSVPYTAGPSILLYNKDLFQKAGLPDQAPATWAEIESDAKAIRKLGGDTYGFDIPGSCGGCLSFTVQPLIWASGGQTMTAAGPDQTTSYASSPQVAATFTFYRDLWKAGVANPAGQTEAGATWGQDFQAGKVGIILAGSWLIPAAEKAGYHIGTGAIPGQNGSFSTFAGGDNIGLAATSKKQDAAWTFVQWLFSPEQQTSLVTAGLVPVRTDVMTDQFKKDNPVAAIQVQVSTQSNAPNSIATNALQLSATSPWLAAFQAIVFHDADVTQTLTKADSDSKALIKQAYEQVPQ
jgi:multiple sugar transport system substrate-binding protein